MIDSCALELLFKNLVWRCGLEMWLSRKRPQTEEIHQTVLQGSLCLTAASERVRCGRRISS